MSGGEARREVRAGAEKGQPQGQGLSPSCSNCSSKLGAALGCCGILHWDAPGIQHWIALGIQHQDALGHCAPTLPASKLSYCPSICPAPSSCSPFASQTGPALCPWHGMSELCPVPSRNAVWDGPAPGQCQGSLLGPMGHLATAGRPWLGG